LSVPKSVHTTKPRVLPKSPGFSRYALDFDGSSQYGEVSTPNNLAGMTELTISGFYRYHDTRTYSSILGNPDGYFAPYTVFVDYNGRFRGCVGDDAGNTYLVETGYNKTGEWRYFTFVYDGSDLILYLEGEEIARTNVGGFTVNTSITSLLIGNNVYDHFFDGKIANLRIYNQALSIDEIRRNMLNYHNPIKNGLVGWWRMEEGTGLTAYDESGNGNDGTLKPSGDPPTWVEQKKWEMRVEAGL